MLAGTRKKTSGGKLDALLMLALLLFGLFLCRRVLEPGMLVGLDSAGHFLKAKFLAEEILPAWKIDGWFPYWHLGLQLSQFYSTGFYLFTIAINIFSLGLIGIETSFQIAVMLSYALIAVTVFIMMRCFGYSGESSFLSGLLALFVGNWYGGGLAGTFVMGLIPNSFGLMLVPLAVGFFYLALKSKAAKWVVLCGLSWGALALSHIFSAFFSAIPILLCFVFYCVRERKFKENLIVFLKAVFVAVLVAGWWLVPFLAKYQEHGYIGQWGSISLPDFFKGLLDGQLVGSFMVSLFCFAGIIAAAIRRKFSDLFLSAAVILPVVLYVLCLNFAAGNPNIFGSIQFVRVIPLFLVFMAASAGIFFEFVFSLAKKAKKMELLARAMVFCLAIVLVFYFHWNVIAGPVNIPLEGDFAAISSVRKATAWLAENTGRADVIANEFSWGEWGAYGSVHILDHYIPLLAKRKVIGGNLPEAAKTTNSIIFLPERLSIETPERLVSLGAAFIVTYSEGVGRALEQNRAYKKEFQDGKVRIFRIAKADSTETSAAFTDFSEEKGKIWFETNYEQERTITIPVNYYPNWTAEINGQKTEIGKNSDNLIVLNVPAGKNSIVLEFREMLYERVLLIFSLLATVYFILFFFPKTQAWAQDKTSAIFRKARNSK